MNPFEVDCEDLIMYPGSFNPWHQGHEACVHLAQKQYPKAFILVMPDRNPFKSDYTSAAQIPLAFNRYFGLLEFKLPNPTSNWIELIKAKKKKLLMGDDSFMSLPRWHRPEIVYAAVDEFIVVLRQYSAKEVLDFAHQLKLSVTLLGPTGLEHVSSSEIKKSRS